MINKNKKGFALITTLLGLALISTLGLAIMWVTSSNFNIVSINSKSQSAYYIAEAGANYIVNKINEDVTSNYNYQTSSQLFEYIEKEYENKIIILDTFEENKGEKPEAHITIRNLGGNEDKRDYEVQSVGKLGKNTRTVNSVISIVFKGSEDNKTIENIIFYSQNFIFKGTAVNAPKGSMITYGIETHNLNGGSELNISDMYFNGPVKMDGGSASFGNKDIPGNIYVNGDLDFWNGKRNVYGDLWIDGNFRLKDAIIHGDVYVNGDLQLGWTPEIHKNIYYTGDLIAPSNYNLALLSKCIKVDKVTSFEIPEVNYNLREDDWYIENGYSVKANETGVIPSNAKMLVDNYKNTSWQNIKGETIIVSKGDIILRGGDGFTGALIAPYGKVEYSGDGIFNGIIISKNEIKLPKGGNQFILKDISEFFTDDIPFTVDSKKNNEDEASIESNFNLVEVTIKKNIREK